ANSVQHAYYNWLVLVVQWISKVPLGHWPIFQTIQKDSTAWSGFGGYLTSVLLAHAGIRPWIPTIKIIKSPACMARLCEAAFEIFWMGHLKN
ncbi:hypothetical protein EV368DRAFT_15055, partial [Lentinula lateritia]